MSSANNVRLYPGNATPQDVQLYGVQANSPSTNKNVYLNPVHLIGTGNQVALFNPAVVYNPGGQQAKYDWIYESIDYGAPYDFVTRTSSDARVIAESVPVPQDQTIGLPPAYVQVANAENYAPTTLTATFGSANVSTHTILVIAIVLSGSTPTIAALPTDTGGNTFVAVPGVAYSSATDAMQAWTTTGSIAAVADAITVTFGGTTGSGTGLYVFEISNVAGVDTGASAHGSSALSTTPVTTNSPLELVVAATLAYTGGTGVGAGYTLIQKTAGFAAILEYQSFSSAGVHTATAVVPSNVWDIVAVPLYGVPAIARQVARARSIAESVSVSDAVARASGVARGISESIGGDPFDSVSMVHGHGGTSYTGSISESVGGIRRMRLRVRT